MAKIALLFVGLGLGLCLSACDGDPEYPPPRTAANAVFVPSCKQDPAYHTEAYPRGTQPARPYRVVGMVDAMWNFTPASRFRTLQIKGCQLGADAVIDIHEEAYGQTTQTAVVRDGYLVTPRGVLALNREVTTTTPGRPIATGMAVVYTDKQPQPR